MATSLHDVLHGMLEDAQKYQVLAKRANSTLSGRPGVGLDDDLVAGALKEIERLSHSQAREAKRLLARGGIRVDTSSGRTPEGAGRAVLAWPAPFGAAYSQNFTLRGFCELCPETV